MGSTTWSIEESGTTFKNTHGRGPPRHPETPHRRRGGTRRGRRGRGGEDGAGPVGRPAPRPLRRRSPGRVDAGRGPAVDGLPARRPSVGRCRPGGVPAAVGPHDRGRSPGRHCEHRAHGCGRRGPLGRPLEDDDARSRRATWSLRFPARPGIAATANTPPPPLPRLTSRRPLLPQGRRMRAAPRLRPRRVRTLPPRAPGCRWGRAPIRGRRLRTRTWTWTRTWT